MSPMSTCCQCGTAPGAPSRQRSRSESSLQVEPGHWRPPLGRIVLKPTSAAVVVFQSTNEAVFAVEFNPNDSTNIITCGKSHIYFWTLSSGQFTKKQGIFGVRPPPSDRRSQRFFFFFLLLLLNTHWRTFTQLQCEGLSPCSLSNQGPTLQ